LNITWKDKYVKTDEEAEERNSIIWEQTYDRSKFVQSLETIKRTMNMD
jgi:hypothetical protein